MIEKLESLGHKLEDTGWTTQPISPDLFSKNNHKTIYKCTKCSHYLRENVFKAVIMESATKNKIILGSAKRASNLTCDETIVRDIIE
jgi:hypothetical protein